MENLPATLELKDLAYEIALQYFPDEVLQFRHGISATQLSDLKQTPELRRLVQDEQKSIAANGEAFRLRAAAHANEVLDELSRVAKDPDVAIGARLKASELITQWAGAGYGGNAGAIAGAGMQVNLVTNLSLTGIQPTGGVYEVTAAAPTEDDLIG